MFANSTAINQDMERDVDRFSHMSASTSGLQQKICWANVDESHMTNQTIFEGSNASLECPAKARLR